MEEKMKTKVIYIFWGIVLISVSAILVAEKLGIVSFASITEQVWGAAFGVASAALFASYFVCGVRQWIWLFPALFCALIAWRGLQGVSLFGDNLAWQMFTVVAIPFYVGFALDRKRWGYLIPAYVLSVIAYLTFVGEVAPQFYQAASRPRMAHAIMATGADVMFLIALPFFVTYFWSKKNWWALIPAGGFASIGLMQMLSAFIPNAWSANIGIVNSVLLLGFAATMGFLWLRRATQPTGWAIYPAAGFLILAVVAFILGQGWTDLSEQVMAIFFAAGSAIFFLAYFLHGVKNWGWLFPALGCAALAVIIWMEGVGINSDLTGVPLFAAAALPFYVGYAMNRKRWGLLILAMLLTAFTLFLAVTRSGQNTWSGVLFFFLFAIPFFITFFLSKKNWWALIPAGILASFALVVLVDNLVPHQEYSTFPNQLSFDRFIWVLFLGLAATFAAIWLLRKSASTGWAIYPALGFLSISVTSVLLGERFQEVWLLVLTLVSGVMLLLGVMGRKKPLADQPAPAGKA
jgi:hypothetical protein